MEVGILSFWLLPSVMRLRFLPGWILCLLFLLLPLKPLPAQSSNPLRKLPKEFLKGIAAADFQKTSALEYLPFTALELPRDHLAAGLSRPRLIRSTDIHRARAQLYREPYMQWHRLLISQVERFTNGSARLPEPIVRRAEEIKTLAYLYHLEEDDLYRDAAIELLRQVPEPPVIINLEGGRNTSGWGDFLQSAQALVPICVAVDLLYEDLDPDLLMQLRTRISGVAAQLHNSLIYTTGNNHMTVIAVALLATAMIEDNPEMFSALTRQDLWQQGWYSLSQGLGLIAPDGGYAESVYYGHFIMSYLSPFSLYLENVTGARLFQHPVLQRHINWLIAHDKGSGRYSGFDDAFQRDFLILPPIIRQSSQQRNWTAYWQSLPELQGPQRNLVEAFTAFEFRPEWRESDEDPVQFFVESGDVVFRDRQLNPNFHATFLSEREEWFAARHEHVDPFSFEISAFGEDFIVDAGYGRGTDDVNRAFYLSPEAGNGILVDGYGLYRNPIWGDPISSEMTYFQRTPRAAMATLRHDIADVRLQRKLYFIDNQYLLMIDAFRGNEAHVIGLNMNFRGRLLRQNADRLQLQQGAAVLDVLTLGSVSNVRLRENSALFTIPRGVSEVRSLQLEQESAKEGVFLTAFFPGQDAASAAITPQAVSGQGAVYSFNREDGREVEIAVNRDIGMSSGRWRSDAQALWVEYQQGADLSGLLLINATYFHDAEISIEFDLPATIFLERDDLGWYGQLEADPGQHRQLRLLGVDDIPFRLNRQVISSDVRTADGKRLIKLLGGGDIQIGAVRAPKAILRHHPEADMLQWLGQQADSRRSYQFASEYQRQIVRNQITRRTFNGFLNGMSHISEQFFGDDNLMRNAVFIASGLLEASYDRNAASTFIPRIPHRYQFGMQAGDARLAIREDGTFSSSGIDLRRLDVTASLPDHRRVSYRLGRWYEGHQSHEFQLLTATNAGGYFKTSRNSQFRQSALGVDVRVGALHFQPGYHWRDGGGDNFAYLNWQLHRWRGSIFSTVADGDRETRQELSAFGRDWQLFLAGEQRTRRNYQNYVADAGKRFGESWRFLAGSRIAREGDWRWQHAYTELSKLGKRIYFRGRLERNLGNWREFLYASFRSASQRLVAFADLSGFRFKRRNQLEAYWLRRLGGRRQMQHRIRYRYGIDQGRFLNTVSHQLRLPLAAHLNWQPVFQYQLPADEFLLWWGSGLTFGERQNTWIQFIHNRGAGKSRVNYEVATELFSTTKSRGLHLWCLLEHEGKRLQQAEFRLQPLGAWYQPGIYYAYSRNGDRRLEGHLVLRW